MGDETVLDDEVMLAALRAGDEQAFAALVTAWTPWMLRVASAYLPHRSLAEDVVQEAWLDVLAGLARFEGRSSLRTWVFRILTRRAFRTGPRQRRMLSLATQWHEHAAHAVDPARFDAAGGWVDPPRHWLVDADLGLGEAGLTEALRVAVTTLPTRQRQVLVARDVWGLEVTEVGILLGITANHQGVLLHRARSRLRNELEQHARVGNR